MKTRILLCVATAALAAACTPPGRVTPRDYNRFAVKAEEQELWLEAEYRLRQALAVTPDDARLHNNLAVALEAQGKLEEAYGAYKEAARLDPGNDKYRRNLREFTIAHRWELEDAAAAGTAEGTPEE